MDDYKIIDAHAHIFPAKIAEKAVESIGAFYNIPMNGSGTAEDLVLRGSEIHVVKYVVHSTATKLEQVVSINDFIADTKDKFDCFIGFGTLFPGMEHPDKEVDRVMALGLKGIKLHPEFQQFNIDDELMMPIYSAVEGKLPILMHMGDEVKTSSRPKRLAKVLDRFPNLTVIAAHLGGYVMWDESTEYLVGRNLYFDTSSTLFRLKKDKVIEIIRKHGVDKVMFGVDYPMWSHKEELDRFYALGLTKEENEQILYRNAGKLFGI